MDLEILFYFLFKKKPVYPGDFLRNALRNFLSFNRQGREALRKLFLQKLF